MAGTTDHRADGSDGGQWVYTDDAAANPDLDEIVIKQELDTNGMGDFV